MLDDLESFANKTVAMVDSHPDIGTLRHSDNWFDDQVKLLEDSLISIVKRCRDSKTRQFDQNDGLFLSLQIQSAEAATSALLGYTPSAALSQTASTVSNWIQSTLIPNLKGISGKVLTILASLLTPTGWVLKGSIGGGVLGLSNLELEIKFGR
ncbi:hypothetical protein [Halomonas faecis]|uniref:hypothetical protein n=1 Tax=Halomonas faecis TaxID=1562110 RepID=UPI0013D49EB8|nr:hypothetical protein [Halomonas faecis]